MYSNDYNIHPSIHYLVLPALNHSFLESWLNTQCTSEQVQRQTTTHTGRFWYLTEPDCMSLDESHANIRRTCKGHTEYDHNHLRL